MKKFKKLILLSMFIFGLNACHNAVDTPPPEDPSINPAVITPTLEYSATSSSNETITVTLYNDELLTLLTGTDDIAPIGTDIEANIKINISNLSFFNTTVESLDCETQYGIDIELLYPNDDEDELPIKAIFADENDKLTFTCYGSDNYTYLINLYTAIGLSELDNNVPSVDTIFNLENNRFSGIVGITKGFYEEDYLFFQ